MYRGKKGIQRVLAHTVHDYDCRKLLEDVDSGKLTVAELNKYLDHHNLPLRGKKADRVRSIMLHLAADVLLVLAEDERYDEEEEIIFAAFSVVLIFFDHPDLA